MTDQNKACLSAVFFAAMIVLPLLGLGIGWLAWDAKTGAIIAIVLFGFCFLASGALLALVKDLSWLTASLPAAFGILYGLLPDIIPGPIDDAVAFSGGALLSFALWIRRDPHTPRWVIWPLLAAGVYTLVGGFIPGPVDELLAYVLTTGVAVYGISQQLSRGEKKAEIEPETGLAETPDDPIVEVVDENAPKGTADPVEGEIPEGQVDQP